MDRRKSINAESSGEAVSKMAANVESPAPLSQSPAPSKADFEAAARHVLAQLPDEFAQQLSGVVLKVEEFSAADQLRSVDLDSRWELTGLYEGTPLTEQSVWDNAPSPPVISLFRQPLLLEMRETGVRFEHLVRHVVIHEAGHHFGLSDDDMHALEQQAGG